jgi:hypothetical protein
VKEPRLDENTMTKPVMHCVKSLTIRGNLGLLKIVVFPSVTYLELSSSSWGHLSGQDIPHRVEILKTKDVDFDLDSLDSAKVFRTIRTFEGVDSTINWLNDGIFSLSRVRSLHMEEMRIRVDGGMRQPLDLPSILCNHESIETMDDLHLIRMAITHATVGTIRMLRGLSTLIIEECYFEDDALSHLHHMLMPQSRESSLPHLRFLRLSGFQRTPELKYPYGEYSRIDIRQLITDAMSGPPPLHIEPGWFKHWPPSGFRFWDEVPFPRSDELSDISPTFSW